MLRIRKPFADHDHPREIIRQFTPNWFTVTMGTGVVALALNQFPANLPVLQEAGALFWQVNILLFAVCTGLYAARWVFFPRTAVKIFSHPVMPMFLGAIPMGLATIINGFLAFGITRYGTAAVTIAQALWWVDAALAAATGLLVPYMMFTRQPHSMENMTAVWLLPIVACEVTAASGGLLAAHLPNPQAAAQLLIACYVFWAFSVPLAMSVLVVLFLRLVLHKLPKSDMGVSSWLALGPLGTGALGLLILGHDAPAILGAIGMRDVGEVAHGIGIIGGLIIWGYGAWWLVIAAAITFSYLREGLPFNMGWWGFTFPLGVFTLATLMLGVQLNMAFFSIFGAFLVVALVILWIIVATRTVIGGYKGKLFVAPCLARQPVPSPEIDMAVSANWPEPQERIG